MHQLVRITLATCVVVLFAAVVTCCILRTMRPERDTFADFGKICAGQKSPTRQRLNLDPHQPDCPMYFYNPVQFKGDVTFADILLTRTPANYIPNTPSAGADAGADAGAAGGYLQDQMDNHTDLTLSAVLADLKTKANNVTAAMTGMLTNSGSQTSAVQAVNITPYSDAFSKSNACRSAETNFTTTNWSSPTLWQDELKCAQPDFS